MDFVEDMKKMLSFIDGFSALNFLILSCASYSCIFVCLIYDISFVYKEGQ